MIRPFFVSRFVWQLLFIMFAAEFVKGALLVSILPLYMESVLGLSAYFIGWAFALQYIGDNFLRGPLGWLVDQAGYRNSMIFGMSVMFLSVAIISLSREASTVILGCALLGVGSSPIWPCVITGVTEVAGVRRRATFMGMVYIAMMTGVGAGPIAMQLFAGDAYAGAFLFLLFMILMASAIAFMLPGSADGQMRRASGQPPSPSSWMFGVRLWDPHQVRTYFRELSGSLRIGRLFFPAIFLQSFSIGLLTPVVTLFARRVLGLSGLQYSLFLVLGGSVAILCMIPFGRLIDRMGGHHFLRFGFALSALSLFLFAFVRSIPLLYALVVAAGLSYACIIPAWNAFIASHVPDQKRGAVWGIYLTVSGLGMVTGPIVAGILWDNVSPSAPFVASSLVLAILLFVHNFNMNGQKNVLR